MSDASNTYEPPGQQDASNSGPQTVALPDAQHFFPQQVLRVVVSTIAVTLFLSAGYWGLNEFLAQRWVSAFVAVSLSLMCIPIVHHSSTIRERIAASLVMPFALGGLAAFVLLYFQLFHLAWFEAIFNNKGSGEFGLIVFAIVGFVVGGAIGYRIVWSVGIGGKA
jgi:hypothetical protein